MDGLHMFSFETPVSDNRQPLHTFEYNDVRYGFYMLSPLIWALMLGIIVAMVVLAIPVAMVLHYGVIGHHGSLRYFIGYGVIVYWIMIPGILLEFFHVENGLLRFCAVAITPIISIFRTLEAMYSEVLEEMSVRNFISHYCLPMRPKISDGKAIPTKIWDVCSYLFNIIIMASLLGCYQSWLLAAEPIPLYGKGPNSTPSHIYYWCTLWNNDFMKETLTVAPLFQLYLDCFANGILLLTAVISGTVPEPFSENPLLFSSSPVDFWGRRWNLIIHRSLKHGIFKPVLKFSSSKLLGVVAAFTASGLFHEHILRVVFHQFPSSHGPTMVFFWWQALLVIVEHVFGWPPAKLPWPISTILTVLIGSLPAHWFLDTYWRSNFFELGQLGLPMIKVIHDS